MLRAVFAGIGQILLTADKVRARAAEQAWTPDRGPGASPGPARWPADRAGLSGSRPERATDYGPSPPSRHHRRSLR